MNHTSKKEVRFEVRLHIEGFDTPSVLRTERAGAIDGIEGARKKAIDFATTYIADHTSLVDGDPNDGKVKVGVEIVKVTVATTEEDVYSWGRGEA